MERAMAAKDVPQDSELVCFSFHFSQKNKFKFLKCFILSERNEIKIKTMMTVAVDSIQHRQSSHVGSVE